MPHLGGVTANPTGEWTSVQQAPQPCYEPRRGRLINEYTHAA